VLHVGLGPAILLLLSLALTSCVRPRPQGPPRPALLAAIALESRPIVQERSDYDPLLDLVADNRFVLLGESTHGTSEFYRERARITRRLIEEKGFTAVAVEGDWTDAGEVNEFIHGRGPATPEAALSTFDRFPAWMWNNPEAAAFVGWLRDHNAAAAEPHRPVGFYGLDLYDVTGSAAAVIAYLDRTDAAAAARARQRYRCFDRLQVDHLLEYGRRVAVGERRSCAEPVADVFHELTARVDAADTGQRPGDEGLLSAWQNARVAMNGDGYYRAVYAGGTIAWNLRDQHMADTIDALSRHLAAADSGGAKVVVWAHNSHLGDASVTARAAEGEWNVGQLMRQRHDGASILVGFTTYDGTVRAAGNWGDRGRVFRLREARPDSFAALFHDAATPAFLLTLKDRPHLRRLLQGERLERFVGAVYASGTERASHYYETDLAHQFDAIVHIDRTTALAPAALPVTSRAP
jgi:erythromycin esterase-like protein